MNDCISLLAGVPRLRMRFGRRKVNLAADWLAKIGIRKMCPSDWVSNPPSSLFRIIVCDASFDDTGMG